MQTTLNITGILWLVWLSAILVIALVKDKKDK